MDIYRKILEENKTYDEQIKWLQKKGEQIRKDIFNKNENIDLESLKDLSFSEINVICSTIKNRVSDIKFKEILKIREKIKEKEYPDILDVHYYRELKKIPYLSNEIKIKLDKVLANKYRKTHIDGLIKTLYEIDNRLVNDLCKLGIMEKRYRLECKGVCSDCGWGILTLKESEVIKYKEFWEKELKGELNDDDEGEDINYGVMTIYCKNGYSYEISSLNEFNSHRKNEYYIINKKPDKTLDNL